MKLFDYLHKKLQLLSVKCRLETMNLYLNEYIMLFSLQIFQNFLRQKARRISETLALWAIEDLTENQKLDLEFEKFDKVFKKLFRVIKKLGQVFV